MGRLSQSQQQNYADTMGRINLEDYSELFYHICNPDNALRLWYDLIISIPDPYTTREAPIPNKVKDVISYGVLYKIFEYQSLKNAKCINEDQVERSFLGELENYTFSVFSTMLDCNIWLYNDLATLTNKLARLEEYKPKPK